MAAPPVPSREGTKVSVMQETRLDLMRPIEDVFNPPQEDTIGWVIDRAREVHHPDPEAGARALIWAGAILMVASGLGLLAVGFWSTGVI